MARRAKRTARRSRIVSVDFEGVDVSGGRFRIPEDDYLMKVAEASQEESREGNDMIKWVFEGLEGKAKGKKFFVYTSLLPEALWKLRGLLEALGQDVPDSAYDIDLDELIDLELVCSVTDEEYENKMSSKVTDWQPAEEAEEEEKPKRGRRAKDEEEEEEEEKPVRRTRRAAKDEEEEEEKPARRGRRAAAEEEEEEEKPARRKSANGKGRRVVKVSAEEVRGMDEDEMSELIEKHGLEVDLGEHRTPRKKIAAVVAALEEAELLDE